MQNHTTINEYIDSFPSETQSKLREIHSIISKLAPTSIENIKYGIAAFILNDSYLIYFSGNKKHVGMYPIPKGNEAFQNKLIPYKSGKSTLRFSIQSNLPKKLIEEIIPVSYTHLKAKIIESGRVMTSALDKDTYICLLYTSRCV